MKRAYRNIRLQDKTKQTIAKANEILGEYARDGIRVTLRQLYYQFVARDLIPNKQSSYDTLGSIINDGRLAGLIDWNAIADMTRGSETINAWDSPDQIIRAVGQQFKNDLWRNQKYRPEIWIEKEALVSVFKPICAPLRIPYLCCRGYTSQSTMFEESQRL